MKHEEYKIGDKVSSTGGLFTLGIVEKVEKDILTIRWIKDLRYEGPIDFVQIRSASIVRPYQG